MPKYLRELLLSNLLNMVITNTGNESNGNGNQKGFGCHFATLDWKTSSKQIELQP
jgi:hypothetical protein